MALKADITIDIDKQVGELQNLSQIYNARVGDNKTPLTIAWRKNDLPLNLKGLHAYIVGKTGDGSYNNETGKIDFPIGSPVSQFEDDGSGTLDGGQSGLTTLLIPKQMWQKSGLFAGYIGLKSEDGSVFTSKDIWFKVLGNVLDAGVEINYFIGDFDKALAEAEKKLQDKTDSFDRVTNAALNNLREKYREIAQSSEDLASEYTATLNNITDSLKSMQAYIETHNIVTTDKFEKLDKYLTNKVATSYVQPQAFNNLDDLKQKYPNGSNGIMVTTDNGHYYLWNNNSWKDCGTYQSTGIADKSIHLENLSDTLENSLYPNVDEVEITNLLDGYFSKFGTVITQHKASDGDPVHTEKIPVKPGEEYYVYTNNYWNGKAINMMENDTIINYFPSENDAQIKSIKITIPNNVDSLILNGTKQFVPRLFKINSYNQDQDAIDNLAIILKDKEFNFKEINLTQINKTGYWDYTKNGNYIDLAPDNKNALKSYLPVKVKPFEIYRLTGCSAWNARLYEIIDFQGHLISCCDNDYSQSLTTTFMIPKNAAYLEVNEYFLNVQTKLEKAVSIKEKKPLDGLHWGAIGDSWTAIFDKDGKSYVNDVADITGITATNLGAGGTGYVTGGANNWNNQFFKRNIDADTDICTIFGSFNDAYYPDFKFGQKGDTDTATMWGAMLATINNCYKNNPDVLIGIISPGPWGAINPFKTDTMSKLNSYSDTTINDMAINDFAEKYVQTMKEFAQMYSLPFLDLYHQSNLRPWNDDFINKYYHGQSATDTTHPNPNGLKKYIAPRIASFLEKIIK